MRYTITALLLVLTGVSFADFREIGAGGGLATNRPFCGS